MGAPSFMPHKYSVSLWERPKKISFRHCREHFRNHARVCISSLFQQFFEISTMRSGGCTGKPVHVGAAKD